MKSHRGRMDQRQTQRGRGEQGICPRHRRHLLTSTRPAHGSSRRGQQPGYSLIFPQATFSVTLRYLQTWPRFSNTAFSHLGSTSQPTLGGLLRHFFLRICNLHWLLVLQPGFSAEMVFLICCFSKPGSSRRPSWNSPDMTLESSQ